MKTQYHSVDVYIATFPKEVQTILKKVRAIIFENAPNAIESISYGMPAYKSNEKVLVYFGGFKKHIGFYATPTGHTAFEKELSQYKQGKGSVQFQINQPIPYHLIAKIVAFRLKENE